MSLEEFESTLIKVKDQTERVCLHLMGEPLGHPHFLEILKVCERHQVFVELTTNGTLLPRRMQDLMSPAIGQVNISVHSFEANYPEKEVAPYLETVFQFVELAQKENPKAYINLRIWDLQEPVALTSKNKKIRDLLEKKYQFSFDQISIDVRRKKGYQIQEKLYVHFDSRFIWPALEHPVRHTQGTCQALKHHVGIHADGTVVACCLDKEANLALGNIHEQPLEEILKSPRALKMKKGFDEGHLVEDLCQRCNYIERFSRKKVVKS